MARRQFKYSDVAIEESLVIKQFIVYLIVLLKVCSSELQYQQEQQQRSLLLLGQRTTTDSIGIQVELENCASLQGEKTIKLLPS